MPVANLNNVATQNDYVDALTVEFVFPRNSFSIQVFNASVYYQVGVLPIGQRDISWEGLEHFLAPTTGVFNDPVKEGFQPNTKFAGIRFKSATSGQPARVTVS